MRLLYPKSNQFPFDDVCKRIIQELEKRGWKAPHITVRFHKEPTFSAVLHISGPDFILSFFDFGLSRSDDLAAVHEISIPGKKIEVYSTECGPTLYTGSIPTIAALKRRPTKYKGFCLCKETDGDESCEGRPHIHTNRRSPLLISDEDGPDGKPKTLDTAEVMEEFRQYLEEVVLQRIMSHPVAKPAETTSDSATCS